MSATSRVTDIGDRYQLTFVSFHRNGSDTGALYYRPSPASKRRLAFALQHLAGADRVTVTRNRENPSVYRYHIWYRKE